jgi:hypothetical protein
MGRVTLARAIVLVALAGCSSDREVRRIASGLMHCPASAIAVRDKSAGDTSETYVVEGCGRRETLVCNSPDYVCFLAP